MDNNSKPKILLTNHYSQAVIEVVERAIPQGFDFMVLNKADKNHLLNKASEADYFLASGRVEIDKDVIDAAANLKMIQRTGVGTDTLDLRYLKEKKIPVYVNQGVNSESVAEHTIMLILSTLRNLSDVDHKVKLGNWEKNEIGIQCRSLAGMKIGLVGLGNIGLVVAKMLQPFNVTVLYHKRTRLTSKQEIELSLNYVDFESLLSKSDIVTLHCPLSKDTKGMLGEREIKLMKTGSFIINTARGALIDETALIRELSNGHLAAAGLDVYQDEPLPKDSPLLRMNNVTLTPHTGGLTLETFSNMMQSAFQNIDLFHKGELDRIKNKLHK